MKTDEFVGCVGFEFDEFAFVIEVFQRRVKKILGFLIVEEAVGIFSDFITCSAFIKVTFF